MVALQNHSDEEFAVKTGDRIAQLVIQRYVQAEFVPVSELPGSERGATGFGSSGVK
jgi:dUTP pyrophosphatase